MKLSVKNIAMSTVASITILAAGGVASAQDVDETEVVEDGKARLGTIVVTSQRRTESIQDVPIPVTAFDETLIADLNLNDTMELAQYVPSMIASHNAGLASANSYWIRGLGNTQSVATFDPPVGSYVDDIYIARQNANNYAFLDTERVEVLRGPQGTLFGRNTTGGAVNVIMAKPGEEFGGNFEVSAGSYDRYLVKGTIDAPVSDTVLTKVSGYYLTDDGFLDNKATGDTLNGAENFGLRGDVRLLPTDKLTVDLAVEYFSDTGTYLGVVGLPEASSTYQTTTTPVFYDTYNGLPQTDCDGDVVDILLIEEAGNCALTETIGLSGKVSYAATDTGSLDIIFGRRSFDSAYINNYSGSSMNPYAGYILADDTQNEQESLEIKWDDSLFGGRFRYVAGFYYLNESTDYDTNGFSANASVDPTGYVTLSSNTFTHDVETSAVYLQGDYDIVDQLTLTLGARYTYERKNLDFHGSARFDGMGFTSADLVAEGIPLELEENRVTPRIALTYTATEDLMFYASATNGFKSGGWNGNAPSPNRVLPFDPEITWSYELGTKGEFFDSRLRVNANLYSIETEDLQITSGVILPGESAIVSLARNAGTLEAQGLEFETAYVFNDNFSGFLNGAIMDAKYSSVLTTPGVPDSSQVTLDTEPVRTPDFQLAGGITYDQAVPALGGNVRSTLAYRHNEPYYVSTLNTSRAPTEDYVDLSIGYVHETGEWGMELRGTNLTEQETITANFLSLFPGQPRRFNLKLWVNF
ncbi:TonB-dependent receptor [Hirschia baltica]|uniref:TonB-dependent receptor n=1 Tax=Hirschia baltica (strain ATCC 49814 / DSM 5838 / IFAM 1418) TaxID=582402 RepID=C6XJB6_HIRBI|nr:TonB-dependent receptor [Hirschia baltica]ACT59211.1 TonB-dependent receptor [Hirschia baltica ATCC 49814]